MIGRHVLVFFLVDVKEDLKLSGVIQLQDDSFIYLVAERVKPKTQAGCSLSIVPSITLEASFIEQVAAAGTLSALLGVSPSAVLLISGRTAS